MPSTVPVLKKMSPQLLVAHLEDSIEFYTKKLGFSLDFRYEDFYAGIVKDSHSIHLKSGTPMERGANNNQDLTIIFSVDRIEHLYEEVLSKSILWEGILHCRSGWKSYCVYGRNLMVFASITHSSGNQRPGRR